MDGLIIIIVLVIIGIYFRRIDKIVTGIAIIDIFLRLFNYVVLNVEIKGFSEYVEKYLPSSIPGLINNYFSGALADALVWVYVICMILFLFYTIRSLFRKK